MRAAVSVVMLLLGGCNCGPKVIDRPDGGERPDSGTPVDGGGECAIAPCPEIRELYDLLTGIDAERLCTP